jgi:hypothetical protein
MPRTKEQLAKELASGKTDEFIKNSGWADLTNAILSQNAGQQQKLLKTLINGNTKQSGETLRGWLAKDAEARAKAFVDQRLADDSLTIAELDEVL